jgi:tetratricopeptide (TPR) repeat protein
LKKSIACSEALVAREPNVPDYRNRLARAYIGLGAALGLEGRFEQSEAATKKAIEVYEALVALQPQRPEYQATLGLALCNLGEALARQARHREALPPIRRAIGLLRPLFDRQPSLIALNQYLPDAYLGLARTLHALNLDDESIDAVREIIKLWPRNADTLYAAACAFARCIPSRSDRLQKQSLGNDAIDALRAAVAAGWSNGASMSREADFAPLGDRDDFRRLVDETMDRAMPVDAFSR